MTMNLTEAIKAVAPHVSKDKILPMLNNVRVKDGYVFATDRYTMAEVNLADAREPLDPSLDTYLTPDDVKAGVVRITKDGMTFANGSTKPLNDMAALGDYPDVRKLFASHDDPNREPAALPAISFGMAHLAKFQARFFPKSSAGLTFTFGATDVKPVLVTHGDFPEYRALVVPLRTEKR